MAEILEPARPNVFSIDKLARCSFILLVFSFGFTQPFFYVFKYKVPYSDPLFLVTALLWFVAFVCNKTQFRWHKFYWLLVLYLASMVVSTIFSTDPGSSFVKLPGEIYLLGLAILTFNFIEDEKHAKQIVYAWLAATAVSVFIGILSLYLFYFDRSNWLLDYTRFPFGTLPPGNYLRLKSTFINGNSLCNYLSAGLMLLLVSFKLSWIHQKIFASLFFAIIVCALLTISPGLGGIALSLGIWYWLYSKKKTLALTGLFCGIALSAAFLFAAAVSPNAQPDPPFQIDLPGIEKRIEPSARGLVWIASWKTFTQYPFTGRGLGQDACDVRYYPLSGAYHQLRDAHNVFLNVAAQQGILGLAAIMLVVFYIVRISFPIRVDNTGKGVLLAGTGIAFFSAFVYQGIGGSFEDARYLWVLVGLILATTQMPESGSST